MLRSRFFWKLFASYTLLLLLTSGLIGFLVHGRMKQILIGELEANLKNHCQLLEPYAERIFTGGADQALRDEVTRIGKAAGVRITLIATDGTVLADSEQDPAIMENHGSRPEVRESLTRPFGITRRYSQTVKYSMLYIASALRRGDAVLGVLRVAIPLREVDQLLASMRHTISFGAGSGLLVALLLGLVVAQQITSPISDMTRVAEHLRDGQYGHRVKRLPNDEIGLLGDTLNRLGEEVARQFAEISKDRAQLQALVSGMVEGVLAVDEKEVVLLCNQAARDLLGAAELVERDRPIWEQVRVAGLSDLLSEARTQGQPIREDLRLWRNGRETILAAHAAAFGTGDTQGIAVVLHDITELMQLEQMRKDFVANVSHELKTPLTAIKGYVESLLEGGIDDPEVNRRFLTKMDHNVSRLTTLVSDLLSLARIESEEAVLDLGPVDAGAVVRDVVKRHEASAAAKGIRVQAQLPEEGVSVRGELEGLTQVVENLLDNAVKYTLESGQVWIRLRAEEGNGVLEVQDTGIGIPERDQARIFERFYRVDKARSRELGGTGLGLSIVKRLVRQMDGEVCVASEESKGSQFTVLLPLATAASGGGA